MAKVKMMSIEIVALLKDSKKVLELLQRRGAVQLSQGAPEGRMERLDTGRSVAILEKQKATVLRALAVLDEYAPAKTSLLASLSGRKRLSLSQFAEKSERIDEAMRRAYDIIALQKRIVNAKAEIAQLSAQMDALAPWRALDLPMSLRGTEMTRAFFGTLPGLYSREDILKALENDFPDGLLAELEVISASREQSCVFALAHKSAAEEFEKALRALGFSWVGDSSDILPSKAIYACQSKIEHLKRESDDCAAMLRSSAAAREDLLFAADHFTLRRDRYEALQELMLTENTFVLSGYVPQDSAGRLAEELRKKFTLAVSIAEPGEDEDVPVLLKNNALVAPLEDITASYSLPSRDDIDPNAPMAVFYYLFFGMMLSDAGYGLLISVVTGLILRFKRPEGSLKLNLQKFFLCGLSTVFWGALFGSWFGNIVNVVSVSYFGGSDIMKPLWFDPAADPMRLLVFSIGLGFVHVIAGLGIKFYMFWKGGKKLDALFDIGLWWVVFAGLLCLVAGYQINTGFPLSTVGGAVAIAGAAGLVLTQGRDSPSLGGKILGGLGSLYGITGYFSDVLSYCRLMALGLVTGIIGTVFNAIGNLAGTSFFGTVMLIAVFAAGHAINLAINCLGAYVHCNRLQYVEFFSKFYEGGGKPFKPLTVNTKYYTFEEETNHV